MKNMCPRPLLIGFDTQYDQEALVAALQGGRNSEIAPYVALISRENKLGDRAAVYINSTRGFREVNTRVSRAWPFPPPCFWKKLLSSKPQAMEMVRLDIVASVLSAGGNVDVPDAAVSSSEARPLG